MEPALSLPSPNRTESNLGKLCQQDQPEMAVLFSDSFRADLSQLMQWRRDVRRFRSDPVDEALLPRPFRRSIGTLAHCTGDL